MMLYHEYLLLKMLTDSNSLLSISQIVEQLKITQRTAYLSINGVNEWLESHDLNKIMTVRNHGYYVQPDEIDKIKSYLKYDLQQGNVKLPSFIRKIAIEFVLLCKEGPVSLKYLNALNGVTNRTTQNDLAKVKEELEIRGLKLDLVRHGYSISGAEEEVRKFVLQKLANIQGTVIDDKISQYLTLKTKDRVQIEQTLLAIEQNSGCYLTDESIFQVRKFICFSLVRYRNKHYLKTDIENNVKEKNNSKSLIFNLLKNLGVNAKHLNSETQLLWRIIESRQISKINKKIESREISKIAAEMINRFSVISGIDLVNNQGLHQALTTHLIAAERRVSYNIQFLNSNFLNIQKKYPEIYFLTKTAIHPFEKYMGKKLTKDEIELIAIYFGGEIELMKTADTNDSIGEILLVCGSGIGTSRLLKIQLENHFSDQLKVEVVTKQDYEKLNEVRSDLVISTLPVTNKGAPIININRILTDNDLQNIKQHLSSKTNYSSSLHNSPVVKATQILDIVSEYAQVKDFTGLTTALQSYFSKIALPVKKEESQLLSLSQLLPENRISFKSGKYSWQESVELAGRLLEKDNVTNSAYTEKMYLQIKKYGPYMKVLNNVMLLHAKPDDPKKYSLPGMSLVCFKNPIKFNYKVKANYVFSLYAPNANSHLEALKQLTEMFSDNNLLTKFKSAENGKTISKIFNSIEKGDANTGDNINRSQIGSIEY